MWKVFHTGLNYDNHVIIKELAKEFEQECKCLAGNTEKKKKTFSVPITRKEKKRIDKNGKMLNAWI